MSKAAIKYCVILLFGIIFSLFLQKAIEVRGGSDFWNVSVFALVTYGAAVYVVFWKGYSRLLGGLFELDRSYAAALDLYSYTPTLLLLQYFLFHRQVKFPFEQKLLALTFFAICSLKAGQFIFLLLSRKTLKISSLLDPKTLGLFLLLPLATFAFIRSYDYFLYKTVESRLIVKPLKEVSINNEVRQALYSPSPYLPGGRRIEKTLTMPPDAMMSFGIGIARNSWFQSDTGAVFEIHARAEGRKEKIYSRFLDPRKNANDRGWIDEKVDLAPYSGREVTLVFETSVPYSEIDSLKKILKTGFGYTKWLNIGKYGNVMETVWSAPRVFSRDQEQGPNVILISFDTLGAGHLGCYGHRFPTTPHLDRFAQDGVLFTNCIVQAPWTLPSHVSMLTGQNCRSHGVVTGERRLADSFVTLAEVLRDCGYETVAITEGGNVSSVFGLHQGFSAYDNGTAQDIATTFGKAMDWLERKRTGKFFLFLHTYETHAFYEKREPYYSRYSAGYQGFIRGDESFLAEPESVPFFLRPQDRRELAALYDSEVSYIDSHFKKLDEKLEQLKLKDSTVVLVTSDHGEGFGEHDYYGHGNTLHDELLRAPLLMRGPGLPPRLIVDAQVRTIDLMPTLIELCDYPIPGGLDGVSLVPLLKQRQPEMEPALSEVDEPAYGELKKSLRTNALKLIVRGDQNRAELYDLTKDPLELNGASRRESHLIPTLEQELQAMLASCASKHEHLADSEKSPAPSIMEEATFEQLKALGYLN